MCKYGGTAPQAISYSARVVARPTASMLYERVISKSF